MSWESRHGPWIEKSKVLHLQHHHPIPESPERCCEHRLCEISKKCWVKGSFHWSLGCILYIDGIWWHPGRFYNIELDSASPTCHLWASCTVLLAHFKPARQQRRSQNHWVQGCHALANINGMKAFLACENSEAKAKPPANRVGGNAGQDAMWKWWAMWKWIELAFCSSDSFAMLLFVMLTCLHHFLFNCIEKITAKKQRSTMSLLSYLVNCRKPVL